MGSPMPRHLLAALSTVLLAGCSVVGVRDTEEPKFDVIAHVGDIEIRQYGPRIAAEASIAADEDAARNQGFRKIAGYIFGANRSQTKIAMTAPVAQSSETIAMTAPVAQDKDAEGRWVIRFFMPAAYTLATLPQPTDPDVHLVEVPAATMAVLRYTGFWGADTVAEKRAALVQGLKASKYTPQGTPVAWFYDPPWTIPFLRRNEVAVPVTSGN
eukprot:gene16069-16241_t